MLNPNIFKHRDATTSWWEFKESYYEIGFRHGDETFTYQVTIEDWQENLTRILSALKPRGRRSRHKILF